LDYGCGTGYFLQTCQKAGWQIQGIEPDEGARNLAEKLTQTTMQADAFASFFDTQKYSVITLWHVLEHIHRLDDTIIRLKSLLHESGKLVIAVPNHDSREAKYYDAYWAAYDVPRHLYHFTPKTLPVLMQRLGFRLVERLPMYYDAYYISLLSERYKYGKTNFWKAFWYGRNSNQSAQKTGDYSSVIYVFEV
jgi:SAM-dependent methyltransferase